LSAEEARVHEPHLGRCLAALWSPNGGRLDAARLVGALEREVVDRGVEFRFDFSVDAAERSHGRWTLRSVSGASVEGRQIVNSAGVESAHVARRFGSTRFRIYPCLGEYAKVTNEKREWVSLDDLRIPVRVSRVGVHLTRLLSGELISRPTATYLDAAVAPAGRSPPGAVPTGG